MEFRGSLRYYRDKKGRAAPDRVMSIEGGCTVGMKKRGIPWETVFCFHGLGPLKKGKSL